MRRPRLFDILKNKRYELTDDDFEATAEPNPFSGRRKGMDSVVRDRGPSQGLDKTARAKKGPNSGVSGSQFDDMVRDVTDLDPYIQDTPRSSYGDTFMDPRQFKDDDDDLYLSPNDRSYRRNEFNQERDIEDLDFDAEWDFMRSLEDDDEFVDEDDEPFDDEELDDEQMEDEPFDEPEEESRYEGVVRPVKGAYLVSKKQQPDDTYTEVWVYNTGKDYKSEANIRKAILAGTDIDPLKNFSEDGSQECVIDSLGNIQYITLTGLPD